MSKKKLSKLLALYLPYVVIGLVATNLGEAWRLAAGKELGDKIVSLMGTLPAAFANRVLIIREQHKVRCQRGRATAAPCKTAAGGLIAFAAHLCTRALIGRAPHNVYAFFCTQKIAVLVGQDHRTVLGGGDAVFSALAGGQFVDKNSL